MRRFNGESELARGDSAAAQNASLSTCSCMHALNILVFLFLHSVPGFKEADKAYYTMAENNVCNPEDKRKKRKWRKGDVLIVLAPTALERSRLCVCVCVCVCA